MMVTFLSAMYSSVKNVALIVDKGSRDFSFSSQRSPNTPFPNLLPAVPMVSLNILSISLALDKGHL